MAYSKNSPEPKTFAEADDETIAAYVIDLIDLDSQSDEIQASKKRTYEDARDTYGKKFARSLKRAVALHRMDADKRTEADEIDAEAERFLTIIRKPSAPRATRTREIIEEFDPETGEIKSSTAARKDVQAETTVESTRAVAPDPAAGTTLPAGTQVPSVETHSRHGAGGADDEAAVATVAAPSSANSSTAASQKRAQTATEVGTGGGHLGPASRSSAQAKTGVPSDQSQAPGDGQSQHNSGVRVEAVEAIPHPVEGTTPTSTADGDRGGQVPPPSQPAPVVPSNVTQLQTKKRWTFNDPAHVDCLDPGTCGGFSNIKICQKCREAADTGQVA